VWASVAQEGAEEKKQGPVKPVGRLLAGLRRLLAGLVRRLAVVPGWLVIVLGWLVIVLGWLVIGLGKLLASGKWLIFLAALGALVAGGWLLYSVWQGPPVAAAFTRVGGDTHVETALEASRFWTIAPRGVVTVSANANQQTMLAAAQCAMAYDTPLLFRSRDPKQERMVDATIASWGLDPNGPDVASVDDAKRCLQGKDRADVRGLSAYDLPGLPLPGPNVAPARDGLAPAVVIAAEWAPNFPPDIAVGLALSAHMARTYDEVSLVVVPRYVEANSTLETQLREPDLVEGGVILGDQKILSEDTRALLRQLLTSTNEQAVLGEIRTNLQLIAPLLAALAGLFAAGLKPEIGEKVVQLAQSLEETGKKQRIKGRNIMVFGKNKKEPPPTVPPEGTPVVSPAGTPVVSPAGIPAVSLPESDWLKALGDDRDQDITVWLRNGPKFTGKVDNGHSTVTVLRLTNVKLAELEAQPDQTEGKSGPSQTADVLVLFEEIRLISVSTPPPTTSAGKQSAETAQSHNGPTLPSSRTV
jgi:hypothetical protein